MICNFAVEVEFENGIVHIKNDENLKGLLSLNLKRNTEELVFLIKERYQSIFTTALNISSASLIVEIWGHVYSEILFQFLKTKINIESVQRLTRKGIANCTVIDCGESKLDRNRGLWNILAPFKNIIITLLPKNIIYSSVKST